MSNNTLTLQMLDLYFSKYDFKQERGKESKEYSTTFKIEYAISEDNEKIRVTIDTTVSDDAKSMILNLQTVGVFKIEGLNVDEKISESLIKNNIVTIIFPFIRSQISLLTTQPGIMPVVLPPININALLESQETKSDSE